MVADSQRSPDAPIDSPLDRGLFQARGGSWIGRLTSPWTLGISLLAVILIAGGPLQQLDLFLAKMWLYRLEPDLIWFAQNVLDRIASNAVCLPILSVIAIVLARRRRTWRPIVFTLLTEAAFLIGVGGMKILLARGVTYDRDPRFFQAGYFEMGSEGISFPSGHAAEAVLIYGAAVYLIACYSSASPRVVRLLCWGVGVITVNSVTVSFMLGWHWASDLVGGVLAGGLFLRLLIDWDRRGRARLATADDPGSTPVADPTSTAGAARATDRPD
ncbi:phosphatase PAP2 family protein [Brachybacterium sacelli]|uniref:Membrane-associated phospholipid phosphatase n=1 Tax=Brachybacterium sacelli TaxID=173364 RepID=A0ABS4X4F8_9MICO|nr:phosphatase PAP2 family protein [Brachybacterium sacelli]MBP2383335.1 membrane-associated phospholipid phosphatase [Brachybacterium sacelli]